MSFANNFDDLLFLFWSLDYCELDDQVLIAFIAAAFKKPRKTKCINYLLIWFLIVDLLKVIILGLKWVYFVRFHIFGWIIFTFWSINFCDLKYFLNLIMVNYFFLFKRFVNHILHNFFKLLSLFVQVILLLNQGLLVRIGNWFHKFFINLCLTLIFDLFFLYNFFFSYKFLLIFIILTIFILIDIGLYINFEWSNFLLNFWRLSQNHIWFLFRSLLFFVHDFVIQVLILKNLFFHAFENLVKWLLHDWICPFMWILNRHRPLNFPNAYLQPR